MNLEYLSPRIFSKFLSSECYSFPHVAHAHIFFKCIPKLFFVCSFGFVCLFGANEMACFQFRIPVVNCWYVGKQCFLFINLVSWKLAKLLISSMRFFLVVFDAGILYINNYITNTAFFLNLFSNLYTVFIFLSFCIRKEFQYEVE